MFTITDADGDTLTVDRGCGVLITIRGEDGHRSVYLTAADVEALKAALDA